MARRSRARPDGLDETGRARRELRAACVRGGIASSNWPVFTSACARRSSGHPLQLGVAAEAEPDALVQPLDRGREVAPVEEQHPRIAQPGPACGLSARKRRRRSRPRRTFPTRRAGCRGTRVPRPSRVAARAPRGRPRSPRRCGRRRAPPGPGWESRLEPLGAARPAGAAPPAARQRSAGRASRRTSGRRAAVDMGLRASDYSRRLTAPSGGAGTRRRAAACRLERLEGGVRAVGVGLAAGLRVRPRERELDRRYPRLHGRRRLQLPDAPLEAARGGERATEHQVGHEEAGREPGRLLRGCDRLGLAAAGQEPEAELDPGQHVVREELDLLAGTASSASAEPCWASARPRP